MFAHLSTSALFSSHFFNRGPSCVGSARSEIDLCVSVTLQLQDVFAAAVTSDLAFQSEHFWHLLTPFVLSELQLLLSVLCPGHRHTSRHTLSLTDRLKHVNMERLKQRCEQ